jgi:bacillithiol system protein YtxJ
VSRLQHLQHLRTPESARAVFDASERAPVFIFKHSTACGLSDQAHAEFRAFLASAPEGFSYYRLDVLESRAVSDLVEDLAGVRHESPQVLVLWRSRCVWHASHRGVRESALSGRAEALRQERDEGEGRI